MKNDVEKYIAKRKRTDKAFAKDFESGYAKMVRRLPKAKMTAVSQRKARK
jgi:hypothetical protein